MTITTTGLSKLTSEPDSLGLRDFEVPSPRTGEVVMEVIATGICGTDLHIAANEFPSNPPVTMGHEITGEVREVGEGVDEGLIGDRFAIETYFTYCGQCAYCRDGSPNLCTERRSIGSHVNGGFARWVLVPARNLHKLPDHVGRVAGALAEPLACVTNCLLDPSVVEAADSVMIVGPGTMGILTAQVARASGGVVTVFGLPRDAERLRIAAALGFATETIGDSQEPVGSFDVVCECSGSAGGASIALEAVKKGGRFIQVGIFGKPITIDVDAFLFKEVPLTSGFASTPRSWERAMALLEEGLVDLDPLVSASFPLADWEQAFEATRAGNGMKFLIDPRNEGLQT